MAVVGGSEGKQVVRACSTMLPRNVSAVEVSFIKDDVWGEPIAVPAAAVRDEGYPQAAAASP